MKKLVLLYWGCVFLMYLSQVYYPTEPQHNIHKHGERHFMLRKSDIFMIIVIIWMTCFSFLRTQYNDSPLSSKKQKNNCRQRHPGSGCPFSTLFRVSVRLQQRKTAVFSLLFPYGLVPIFDASYQQTRLPTPIF